MNFLARIPFLKVLLPFMTGIICAILSVIIPFSFQILIIAFILTVVLYFMLQFWSASFLKILYSFSFIIAVFSAGYIYTNLYNERVTTTHYSRIENLDTVFISGYISEIPVEKAKTIKAQLTLQSVKTKDK